MSTAFTHCALHVCDLDESIAFYEDYCGLKFILSHGEGAGRTVWMASPGAEDDFVLVMMGGGARRDPSDRDMTHYGFAVSSREDIDRIAQRADREGRLHWTPKAFKPPTGYLCAVTDPTGYIIEFSYGQPLGPGAEG